MKVLVIGATGFLGSHVARAALAAGHDVRAMRRSTSSTLALEDIASDLEFVTGNLHDPASLKTAMKGCDWVFSTAGYYPLYSFNIAGQQEQALIELKNLVEAAKAQGVQRFLYTSSMSTIGKAAHGRLATEKTPYDPAQYRGAYYRIKYAMEQYLLQESTAGFPTVILNPTGIFGDYDVKPTSGQFIVLTANGKVPFMVDAPCNMIDVRDVASGHIRAAERGALGERYILGHENTTLLEFARQIARQAGVRGPLACLPLTLVKEVARLSEYASRYLLNRDKPLLPLVGLEYVEHGQHFDSTKALRQLDLPQTPLTETIDRALAWFDKHAYLT